MRFSIRLFVMLLMTILLAFAHENGPLKQIGELIISIRTNGGDILFPNEFYTAKENFEIFSQKGESSALTASEQKDAIALLKKLEHLNKITQNARPAFSRVLAAREEALNNSASDYAPELFLDAENELHDAARIFRGGSSNDLEERLNTIYRLYKRAQYQSIRNKLLSEVRIFIQESKDLGAAKYAPRTFALVEQLYSEVENILDKNRFTDPNLQDKANQLAEESQHLLYLTRLKNRLEKSDDALEDWVLQLEKSVSNLAAIINYQPQYSEGIQAVMENVRLSIQELQTENLALKKKNGELSDSIAHLNNRVNNLEGRLKIQKDWSAVIKDLNAELGGFGIRVSENNTSVLFQVADLIFQPGKIEVDQSSYPVLQKLGKSLQQFSGHPMQLLVIQTGRGNHDYQATLADQRAMSCALVVQTSGFIPDSQLTVRGEANDDPGGDASVLLEVRIQKNVYLK